MSRDIKLTGITLIKNGNQLKYPYKACIQSLASYCDQVIVNVGKSIDNTEHDVLQLVDKEFKNVAVYSTSWSEENTGNGQELAIQANKLLPFVNTEWIVYLQADEFILEEDIEKIKKDINSFNPNEEEYTQIELFRTYFYKSLNTRLLKNEIWLGRIFKKGTHTVGGDGMFLNRNSGRVWRAQDTKIMHYSRIGTEQEITNRVRQLDKLFHDEDEIKTFPAFKFETEGLIKYTGKHPKEMLKFYNQIG